MTSSNGHDLHASRGWQAEELDLDAYLARIGYSGPLSPTFGTLRAINRAHAATIPFENVEIQLGSEPRLDIEGLQSKLVQHRRGGYCFEQNILMGTVLDRIGFQVSALNTRILGGAGIGAIPALGHTALRIDLDGTSHLVDVGVGWWAPTEPMELTAGTEATHADGWSHRIDHAPEGGSGRARRRLRHRFGPRATTGAPPPLRLVRPCLTGQDGVAPQHHLASQRASRHHRTMASYVSHTTTDCTDAYTLSEWWKQVLDYSDIPGDPNEPGHVQCMIQNRTGTHQLLFIEVPDPTPGKNRTHLDLRPEEGTRDDELARLLDLGATQVADHRGKYGPGTGWVVLADPEGNEFCILRSEAEVAAQGG